ncbi:MAG: double-strand break repair protein AddB [Boseongicola sp.]
MFDPTTGSRVFGVPPGADFPAAVVDGILNRIADQPPEALARVQIIVNTQRMRRRLVSLLQSGPARLLPRIDLITEAGRLIPTAELPDVVPDLQRKLDLARLIEPLLESGAAPAPRSALFDLADSLAGLLDELHSEGVSPNEILNLDVGDHSEHWVRSLQFFRIVQAYLAETGASSQDLEARRRAATEMVVETWRFRPPETPVLVVGSTGSRGTTFELMKSVASLPQGAIILPGFDNSMPKHVWSLLTDCDQPLEDHPQYRFAVILKSLGLAPSDVLTWPTTVPDAARNQLISLSLRPAPVTRQWRREGPEIGDLIPVTKNLSLIEAPQQRDEAQAIAVALREAVSNEQTAALITPDRTLGRRVAAALARWNIEPDDSGGRPLSLTPPGRFLRQVALMMGELPTAENVVALLKHPLTRTGSGDRGEHLLTTREFELMLRKGATGIVSPGAIQKFQKKQTGRDEWCAWLIDIIASFGSPVAPTLGAISARHIALAEQIAQGPSGDGSGDLWDKETGRKALEACEGLAQEAVANYKATLFDYRQLLDAALQADDARDPDGAHPEVMIWGTLEARAQGAELVILGGLNEGTWPARPEPDPWLSRSMRRSVGLLLPERQIGLSAHDYQQAVAAESVILSRSCRDSESETVPSRWLNRLTYLLNGLPDQNGSVALDQMRTRGTRYLSIAAALDRPGQEVPARKRVAPAPLSAVRPKSYTVTEIEKLIRDPYAIYAKHVLALKPLDPLRPEPSAALKGTVFHEILNRLIDRGPFANQAEFEKLLLALADEELFKSVRWPQFRALWRGHLVAIAPMLAEKELARQSLVKSLRCEVKGEMKLPGSPFSVRGKADRIDRLMDGRLAIYDYKSGGAPTSKQVRHYQRQLLIEAVMAEHGGFDETEPAEVSFVGHIGLNRSTKDDHIDLAETEIKGVTVDFRTSTILRELHQLLDHFDQDKSGYMPRRAMEKVRWEGDYDQLARFGEWADTDDIVLVPLS